MHLRSIRNIVLLCIFPVFTKGFDGLSSQSYTKPLDEGTETDRTRIFFQPSDSRDLSNVVVDRERNVVYVGAVNYLYALDAEDITIKKGEIHWAPDQLQMQLCQNFKGDAVRCQNTIRVLHSVNDTYIFACGTMAFRPSCIYVNKENFKRAPGPGERGKGRSPEDPLSSTVSTMSGNSLFAATTPAAPNKNGIICKTTAGERKQMRTNENDDFWLSDPQFISAFTIHEEDNEAKVIVLLKENAEEIPMEILTQNNDHSASVIYSRLVSICANDQGGNPWILKDQFATFTKMRIACPVDTKRGESRRTIPFFYDEIQSSFVVENPSQPNNPTIYAIFSTPSGAFEATATCVFEMNDIRKYMSTNKYWNKPGASRDLFSTYGDTQSTSPGTCVQDTTALSATRLSFGNDHPIKYGIIKPKEGYAVYQDLGITYSHVVVDRIKRNEKHRIGLMEKEYDVVHYITESGFIKRVVFSVESRDRYWEIPSRMIYNKNETASTILAVQINNGYLYFGTAASLIQLKLAVCARYATCAECSLSNDPYCDWNEIDNHCEEIPFDVPVKRPPLPYRQLNETYCDLNDLNADKKSDVGEYREADTETLQTVNAELRELTERQNASISSLKSENNFLTTKLSESMDELSNLMTNYTRLSALLLQYDSRRRMVIQLYRNTVFSLHACQHDRAQRKTAERKAALEAANQRKSEATLNVTNCEQLALERSEASPCDCNKEVYARSADGTIQIRPRAPFTQSLEACHALTNNLQRDIDVLETIKLNWTNERRDLQKKIITISDENRKLNAALSSGQHIGCGENTWLLYAPTNKMFLFTNKVTTFINAAKMCSSLGGDTAVVETDDEESYVLNVTRRLSPRKKYWIGIKKYKDGTLRWTDGSVVDSSVIQRFPKNQGTKLSNTGIYCVETTPLKHVWHLIPCTKSRRVFCTKEYNGEIR